MLKLIFYIMFMLMLLNNFKKWWIYMNMINLMMIFLLLMNYSIFNFSNFSNFLSIDNLSLSLIMLSVWICSLMIMAMNLIKIKNYYLNLYLFLNLSLLGLLILIFLMMNIFMFYIFFEISLIPIFMMILGWGGQSERIQAGLYLLFYTLFFSLPMLLGLIYIFYLKDTLIMFMIFGLSNNILYLILMLSFFVKMPMFMIHLWLLKAHVESPIAGSMILAGVMLKLGGYGIVRVLKFYVYMYMNYYLMVVSLYGGVILSIMCLMQIDMKLLIAMSSVVHMSMVILGLLSLSNFGFIGSLVLMLSHGLSSSGLFVLANLSYERIGSRSLVMNKGMINMVPLLSLWWFLLICTNMAVPPSMNLLGEIILLISIVSYSWVFMFMLMIMMMFGAIYNLYLFNYSQHGNYNFNIYSYIMINIREYLMLFYHWFPLNILMLNINFILL
uniref:NADH-ubiquinone oxidoreductase chain 4 n=1 Tax=Abaria herringbona TaxID=2996732 RepID=A0A9E8RT14_9NEOP|nr:NADH dehydrogenase subunit 4 [Abaria herringbona]UZZ43709.1 NADH dehydrogenase subunit 4 [Abaria herringbona]